jgi:uncharacterized protein YjbI with pentapeptide repeats
VGLSFSTLSRTSRNLEQVDFVGAILQGAILQNANLAGVEFGETDLTGVKF